MPVERINPATLLDWLSGSNPPAVVDVRDEDHIGGHVSNSIHVPSTTFINKLPALKQLIADKNRVVFYCQYSQQRGPSCAQYYKQTLSSQSQLNQNVYVLDGGFSNWATSFMGKDGHTENFIRDLYSY